MNKKRRTYNPDGVNSRLVGVRFKPEELNEIEKMAHEQSRTLSNMTRLLVNYALKNMERIHNVS